MGLRKLLKSLTSGSEVVDVINEAIAQVDANKTIYKLSELGLAEGVVSLEELIVKMPSPSRAIILCGQNTGVRWEDLPNGYGTLQIEKHSSSRCVLKYSFSENSFLLWHGVFYRTAFKGWYQVSLTK